MQHVNLNSSAYIQRVIQSAPWISGALNECIAKLRAITETASWIIKIANAARRIAADQASARKKVWAGFRAQHQPLPAPRRLLISYKPRRPGIRWLKEDTEIRARLQHRNTLWNDSHPRASERPRHVHMCFLSSDRKCTHACPKILQNNLLNRLFTAIKRNLAVTDELFQLTNFQRWNIFWVVLARVVNFTSDVYRWTQTIANKCAFSSTSKRHWRYRHRLSSDNVSVMPHLFTTPSYRRRHVPRRAQT